MENDPNLTYKAAFQALTDELGRPPTSRDKGWLDITEQYRRAWGPAVETMTRENMKWNPLSDSTPSYTLGQKTTRVEDGGNHSFPPTSGQSVTVPPASQRTETGNTGTCAREAGMREALSGPGAPQMSVRPGTALDGGNGAGANLQEGRGPGEGILAVCEACGQVWERERKRGRPSYVCGECRG